LCRLQSLLQNQTDVPEKVGMDKIEIKPKTLRQLKVLIEKGAFAVPELQREFVWDSRKACDLLDSIYRNYPIGTIVIWKTNKRNEGQLRKSLHILPQFNPANPYILFLIDGQQRLSVLWHLLSTQATAVKNADGKELDFGCIYFDPRADNGLSPFLYRRHLTPEHSPTHSAPFAARIPGTPPPSAVMFSSAAST
jgi:Protein of unknown function DUF262